MDVATCLGVRHPNCVRARGQSTHNQLNGDWEMAFPWLRLDWFAPRVSVSQSVGVGTTSTSSLRSTKFNYFAATHERHDPVAGNESVLHCVDPISLKLKSHTEKDDEEATGSGWLEEDKNGGSWNRYRCVKFNFLTRDKKRRNSSSFFLLFLVTPCWRRREVKMVAKEGKKEGERRGYWNTNKTRAKSLFLPLLFLLGWQFQNMQISRLKFNQGKYFHHSQSLNKSVQEQEDHNFPPLPLTTPLWLVAKEMRFKIPHQGAKINGNFFILHENIKSKETTRRRVSFIKEQRSQVCRGFNF